MTPEPHDPRDIPILTESAGSGSGESVDINAAHAAILTETLKLADSLLRRAARDTEASSFERVFDRLRSALPELVDRTLREAAGAGQTGDEPAETRD